MSVMLTLAACLLLVIRRNWARLTSGLLALLLVAGAALAQ